MDSSWMANHPFYGNGSISANLTVLNASFSLLLMWAMKAPTQSYYG